MATLLDDPTTGADKLVKRNKRQRGPLIKAAEKGKLKVAKTGAVASGLSTVKSAGKKREITEALESSTRETQGDLQSENVMSAKKKAMV